MAKAKKASSAPKTAKGGEKAAGRTARKKTTTKKTAAAPAAAAPSRKRARGATAEVSPALGPRKRYLKTRPVCRVTFSLPAPDSEKVCIIGDFNNWNQEAHPMRKQKGGLFTITLELERGRAYRYRYFIDGFSYENDYDADWYDPNPYGGDDSVVNV